MSNSYSKDDSADEEAPHSLGSVRRGSGRGPLRIALVADGPPADRQTDSGLAYGLLEALRAHPSIGSVVPIDASFRGLWQALVADSVKFSESRWLVAYSQGRFAIRVRSRLLRQQIRRYGAGFDMVLLIRGRYEPFPFPYAMFIDTTVALSAADWPPMAPSRTDEIWSVEADKEQLRAATHVFTAGRYVADHLVDEYGIPADRVTPVGCGVNYPVSAIPARSPWPQPTILFVHHDFERQGGDVLLEAFARVRSVVPGARLLLVGPGACLPEGTPGIALLGRVDDRHRLSELYRSATVFCLPARFEPYGVAVLEAMAHGLPCVATRVGAMPEILHDGQLGLLVDPEDVQGLADSLTSLLHDPGLQDALSRRARRAVEAHKTWDAVADRLVKKLLATVPSSPTAATLEDEDHPRRAGGGE